MKTLPRFSWEVVKAQWMPDDPFRWEHKPAETEAHYRAKYDAVVFSGARDIAEIGVRAGYGAAAMLQSSYVETYTGYDNSYDGAHYYRHAQQALRSKYKYLIFRDRDTQREDIDEGHDFVHVDGDHSYEGAHHDIWMCLRLRVRWILVDDYNDCEPVKEAVHAILREPYPYKIIDSWVVDEPLRGAVLLRTACPPSDRP